MSHSSTLIFAKDVLGVPLRMRVPHLLPACPAPCRPPAEPHLHPNALSLSSLEARAGLLTRALPGDNPTPWGGTKPGREVRNFCCKRPNSDHGLPPGSLPTPKIRSSNRDRRSGYA